MRSEIRRRVIFITSSMNLGGAERQLLLLCNELRSDLEIEIITLDAIGPLLEKYKRQFPKIKIIDSSSYSIFVVLMKLANYIKASNPDLVITWLYKADILGGIATKLAGKTPVVWSARNSSIPKFGFFKKFALSLIARRIPTVIVANGKPAIDFHIAIGYPNHKIVRIPNLLAPWVYTIKSESRMVNRSDDISPLRVGIAARQLPGKGILETITAVEKSGLNIKLLLIGQKSSQTSTLHLSEGYNFYDVKEITDDTELAKWFKELDLYLMSSTHWESQPNSLLEAMAIGCPVLVSNIIELEFKTPSQFTFDFVDDLSFKVAVESLLRLEAAKIKDLVDYQQDYILKEFSRESIVNKWKDLIFLRSSFSNK